MIKIHALLILFLFTFSSCKKRNFIVLKPENDTIDIKRFVLNRHKNPNGYVENYYIELDDYTKIKKQFVPEFEIIIEDSIYSAKGVKLHFSRDIISKDFFFAYHNKTKLICLDTIDKKEMINISQRYSKNDRLHWIKKEIILD
ncbi:hypothetical protein ACFS5J_00050 [Flavobacterium chuncheonense]|uniref:Lipoprotein n=1 Tax=Flavobacterium chuncheonense TaxID=2026653 RepID=A0ABW5YHH0_9FLAO